MNIINELFQTELNYVKNLQTLTTLIKKPLLKQKIIDKEQAQTIFCNIDPILGLNYQFLEKLIENFCKNFGPYSCLIDDDIISIISSFKIYSEYFNNLEKAQLAIGKLRVDSDLFDDFLTQIEFTPKMNNFDLSGFLQMPFYRLFKYKLLFEDLLKKTEPCNPDYA